MVHRGCCRQRSRPLTKAALNLEVLVKCDRLKEWLTVSVAKKKKAMKEAPARSLN